MHKKYYEPYFIIYREDEPVFSTYDHEGAIEFCAESTMSTGIHYWIKEI